MKRNRRQSSLNGYLDFEVKHVEWARKKFKAELRLFNRLSEAYGKGARLAYPQDKATGLCAALFSDVHNDMLGTVSQMLRPRSGDASILMRHSIEAVAFAYILSKQPDLYEVFLQSLPNRQKLGEPYQFKRSKSFSRHFHVARFFEGDTKSLCLLRVAYETASAFHIHVNQTILDRIRVGDDVDSNGYCEAHLPIVQVDEEDLPCQWYFFLLAYLEILIVFLGIPGLFKEGSELRGLTKRAVALIERVRVLFEAAKANQNQSAKRPPPRYRNGQIS